MVNIPDFLAKYHQYGNQLVCEIPKSPWRIEFWPLAEVRKLNADYQVELRAPGYLGFATSGGGEMFAISPTGSIVCLAFVGMSPKDEMLVSANWREFRRMLPPALMSHKMTKFSDLPESSHGLIAIICWLYIFMRIWPLFGVAGAIALVVVLIAALIARHMNKKEK